MQTAIQLYTLRHLEEPLTETIARVGETDLDGVEFAGLGEQSADEINAALDDAGLDVMSAHVGIDALEDDLEATVAAYRAVGCDHLVIPSMPAEAFATREATVETAQRMASAGDAVRDNGLELSFHNHDRVFQTVDGESAFSVLAAEAPDLTFEVDAGWVLAGGHDPAAFIREYGDRVPLVHFKDVDVGANREGDETAFTTDAHQPVELGTGDLDLEAVADATRDVGAEWACYEHDLPDDPVESLQRGSDAITDLF